MRKKIVNVVFAAMVVAAFAGAAWAEPQGWKGEIMPYLWYAGLEGDATVKGQDIEFEKSASDLVDAVEIGGSLLGVVQYDRFLVWGQVDYFSLSTDQLDAEDQPANATLESKMLLWELAAGYQIDGFMENQKFDILLGVRSMNLETSLEVDGHGEVASSDNNYTDPLLVIRPWVPLFPSMIKGLFLNPTFAIGAGGNCDLVYELFPQLEYRIKDLVAVRIGYRTVGWKYNGDRVEDLNLRMAGLIFGIGLVF